jgi:O-antigen ligase
MWGKITGQRWWLLIILTTTAYIVVDLLSNRTPITILINYVTFDPNTAWTRVLIWDFGFAEVLRHPIMGIGLNDWERPHWLTGSVDNFWLLTGMRYGFPGLGLLILALGLGMLSIVRTKNLPSSIACYRTGYMVALISLYFSLGTVHAWGNSSAFTMTFIGLGLWLTDAGEAHGQRVEERTLNRLEQIRLEQRANVAPASMAPQRPGQPIFSRFVTAHSRLKQQAIRSEGGQSNVSATPSPSCRL